MSQPTVQTLTDLVEKYGRLFPEVLKDAVEPVYNMKLDTVFKDDEIAKLQKLGHTLPLRIVDEHGKIQEWRGPLPGQQHVIAALVAAMREDTRRFILRGETGVGKTQIALMTLEMAADAGFDMFPVLITEPRRVTKQWREDPELVYARWLVFERKLTDARNQAATQIPDGRCTAETKSGEPCRITNSVEGGVCAIHRRALAA